MNKVLISRRSGLILFSTLFVLSFGYTTCTQDVCVNGFCDLEVNKPVCTCTLGWTGYTCEVEEEDYAAVDCENGFVGLVDDSYVCSCDQGWWGDTCSEVIADYDPCTDVMCNGQGYCTVSDDSEAQCNCFDGFSGDLCEHEASLCGEEYLLNIASTVYDESWNAGLDCSFFIGLLWTDMVSNDISGYPGLCTCLDMLTENMTDWTDSLGCVIEENFPMSLRYMNRLHCNHCTDDEILDMKAAIQEYSPVCDMFITYRESMPLYWRTPLKCVCLDSLGTSREEVGEWVYCPFTAHAARTDLTAYDNCNDPDVEICDFTYIKHQIEINMKARNPSGFEVCTSAMNDLIDMFPTGGFIANLVDDWCPCYESIAEYWSDGLDVLDCQAVTFYEFTIKDLFLLYCNDATFENKDDLWSVAKIVTLASVYDYATATTCQNFVVYGSALTEDAPATSLSRAKTLLCDCMEGLEGVAVSQGYEYTGDDLLWTSFIPDDFVDGLMEMEDLLELFPSNLAKLAISDCEYVTDDSIFAAVSKYDPIEARTTQFASTEEGGTSSVDYTVLNVCLGLLCTVLTGSNVIMYQSVSRGENKRPSRSSVMAV